MTMTRADAVRAVLDGARQVDVARAAGVCPRTIRNWLRTAGVEARPTISADDMARAHALYADGRTCDEIGAELGFTGPAIRHRLIRDGVAMRRPGPRVPASHLLRNRLIIEATRAGESRGQVARRFGLSPPRVQQIVARARTRGTLEE